MNRRKTSYISAGLCCAILFGVLSGCAAKVPGSSLGGLIPDDLPEEIVDTSEPVLPSESEVVTPDESDEIHIEENDVPLDATLVLRPLHPGVMTKSNSRATIDYSCTEDGYVMVCFTADTAKRLKSQVATPGGKVYTYDITPKEWVSFPLSEGNGEYKVSVFENTSGTKYATVISVTFSVSLDNEFSPFIRPNQYVDYADAANTIDKAAELVSGVDGSIEQVEAIYDWVINNMTYDRAFADTVQPGYLPNIDSVLEAKTGICFDYAALMCAMLRSQFIPCKLVVGYAGTAYHAWINVYTEETGWIEGSILFNGETWERMDPTFASTGKGSEKIMEYIGDGKNYTAMYVY